MRITTKCPYCKNTHAIAVRDTDYQDWKNGKLTQHAFPYLSADEREMLISGICPNCWENIIKYHL